MKLINVQCPPPLPHSPKYLFVEKYWLNIYQNVSFQMCSVNRLLYKTTSLLFVRASLVRPLSLQGIAHIEL
jgi:hypothetical protein